MVLKLEFVQHHPQENYQQSYYVQQIIPPLQIHLFIFTKDLIEFLKGERMCITTRSLWRRSSSQWHRRRWLVWCRTIKVQTMQNRTVEKDLQCQLFREERERERCMCTRGQRKNMIVFSFKRKVKKVDQGQIFRR